MKKHLFRAWDKTHRQYVYFELFDGANNHTPPIYEDADLEPWCEFTGLLDKNGKEIYEGDILRGSLDEVNDESSAAKYEVYYDTEMASFYVRTRISWSDMLEGYTKNFEIIGNIYQNLELLK